MELLQAFTHNTLSFLAIISVIVFIHEFGHYFIAKISGVRIEVFSIGFGPELIGWNDRSGTRWKISLLPLGGYVKMFGDSNAASAPDMAKLETMTEPDKKYAFHTKPLAIKAAVVAAGPLFNLFSAILIFTWMFSWYGKPFSLPEVSQVIAGSPAEKAGLAIGDVILSINGTTIESFSDIQRIVTLHPEDSLSLVIRHNNTEINKTLIPAIQEHTDIFGNKVKVGIIGIASAKTVYKKQALLPAFADAFKETYHISGAILTGVGEMITGKRGLNELGGPIKIAEYSGKSTSNGIQMVLWFVALLSINLGLINLFPIPVLDGGHLMYYAIEAVRGRPVAERFQYYSFRIGTLFMLSLMAFSLINDLRH